MNELFLVMCAKRRKESVSTEQTAARAGEERGGAALRCTSPRNHAVQDLRGYALRPRVLQQRSRDLHRCRLPLSRGRKVQAAPARAVA